MTYPTATRQIAKFADSGSEESFAPNLQRYWNDPAYRAEHEAERAEHYRRANALIDEGIRKARQRLDDACRRGLGETNDG